MFATENFTSSPPSVQPSVSAVSSAHFSSFMSRVISIREIFCFCYNLSHYVKTFTQDMNDIPPSERRDEFIILVKKGTGSRPACRPWNINMEIFTYNSELKSCWLLQKVRPK